MHTHPLEGVRGPRRSGLAERIVILSRSWVFAIVSAIVVIGAVVSCDSTPHAVADSRD